MSAISLYARSSPDFAQKLAHSLALLASSAVEYSPLTQASSLGAEDMVITHLMYEADLAAGMFVLDTEKLHLETMALIDRIEARYQRRVNVYRPDPEAAAAFVQANGDEAMYQSLALRKACCDIRKMEPLARALDGKKGWITGLRREQSDARAEVPMSSIKRAAPKSTRWPTGPWAMFGTTSRSTRFLTTLFTTSSTPASAASPARALWRWAKISALAAGGGKTKAPRSAGCMWPPPAAPASSLPPTFFPSAKLAPHERKNRTPVACQTKQFPPGRAGRRNHLHPA